jgi:hypothetical protein
MHLFEEYGSMRTVGNRVYTKSFTWEEKEKYIPNQAALLLSVLIIGAGFFVTEPVTF